MIGFRDWSDPTLKGRGNSEQIVTAVEYNARLDADAWLGYEIGMAASSSEVFGGDFTGEIYVGPRVTIRGLEGGVNPYFGAGLTWLFSYLSADESPQFTSDKENSFAGYAHVGADLDVWEHVNLGADLRVMGFADLDYYGVDGDQEYVQATVYVNVTW